MTNFIIKSMAPEADAKLIPESFFNAAAKIRTEAANATSDKDWTPSEPTLLSRVEIPAKTVTMPTNAATAPTERHRSSLSIFDSKNTEAAILDSVKILKKKSLEKQRDKINERIRQFICVTAEDYEMLNNLQEFAKEFCKLMYDEDANEAYWNSDESLVIILRDNFYDFM